MPRGEGIKPLGSLFEKYKQQLVAPQGSVVKSFCELVDELYGFKVEPSKVSYSVYSKTLTLKVSGPLKSELLLRKVEILDHLKGRLGVKSAPKTII